MVSMQRRETNWTPMKALGVAARHIESLMIPELDINLEKPCSFKEIIIAKLNEVDFESYEEIDTGVLLLSGFYKQDSTLIQQKATQLGVRLISSKNKNK